MNFHAGIGEARDTGSLLLAVSDALIDNMSMIKGPSATEIRHRPFIRQIEYRLICIGMSVIAYLLERAILRSIKRGGTRL